MYRWRLLSAQSPSSGVAPSPTWPQDDHMVTPPGLYIRATPRAHRGPKRASTTTKHVHGHPSLQDARGTGGQTSRILVRRPEGQSRPSSMPCWPRDLDLGAEQVRLVSRGREPASVF